MSKILISGAAGQLGQRVIHHLLNTYNVPASNVIAATRSPEKLKSLVEKGVEVRKADFNEPDALPAAFTGADRLLIISTDAIDTPGKRLIQHTAAVNAAVKAGVKHIAYTSMPSPDKSLITFAHEHLGSENAVKTSGLSYTIFRDAWYIDNYLHFIPHNLSTGKWAVATGQGKVANISREDCALAIAASLAANSPGNNIYTLTGPQLLTAEEIASIISDVANKPYAAVQVTDAQLTDGLVGAGLPKILAEMLVSSDANTREGNFSQLTDDFKKLTGKEPQSLQSFFKEHKAAL